MKKTIVLLLIVLPIVCLSQTKVQHVNNIWLGYGNSIAVNKKWSVLSDVLYRTTGWTNKFLQTGVRGGVSYSLNKKWLVAAGFTWFGNGQYNDENLLIRNEWRPWADATYLIKNKKSDFLQRVRVEERFMQLVKNGKKTSDYEGVTRFRYRAEWMIPFSNKHWGVRVGDEIMFNVSQINNNRFFDQNRTYAALLYNATPSTQIQFHYMKILQWRSSNKILEDQNVLRVHIFQQLHLNKKHV